MLESHGVGWNFARIQATRALEFSWRIARSLKISFGAADALQEALRVGMVIHIGYWGNYSRQAYSLGAGGFSAESLFGLISGLDLWRLTKVDFSKDIISMNSDQ